MRGETFMKGIYRMVLAGIGIAIAVWPIAARASEPSSSGHALRVVVSIRPLAYFVHRIAGEGTDVTVLIPPGADPHVFEPTAAQMRAVSTADLYVEVGSGLAFEERWRDRFRTLNPSLRICTCARGIPLREMAHDAEESVGEAHGHGRYDPHVWLSPDAAGRMAEAVGEALIELDPAGADRYRERTRRLRADLKDLRRRIERILSETHPRLFLVVHPAWGYFADAFGLRQIAVEKGGKAPSARRMAEVIRIAREAGIRTVFNDPRSSPRTARRIAAQIGGRLEVLDPLAEDYPANLLRAARLIAEEARHE